VGSTVAALALMVLTGYLYRPMLRRHTGVVATPVMTTPPVADDGSPWRPHTRLPDGRSRTSVR
jgi:hypothetical protein